MPELPEVETICQYLKETLTNKKILSVKIYRKDLRIPICDRFRHAVTKVTILNIYRGAKHVIMQMDSNDLHLIFHLGMTGKLLYNSPISKHDHLVFNLEKW